MKDIYLRLNASQYMALKDMLLEALMCRQGRQAAHTEVYVDVLNNRETTTEELLAHIMDPDNVAAGPPPPAPPGRRS